MPDGIELTLTVASPSVIAGECLPVVATVRNGSDSAVTLDVLPTSPVQYVLTSKSDPSSRVVRSPAEGLAIAVGDSRVPTDVGDGQTVGPGETHAFEDDPAACHREVLPPGEHVMVAICPVEGDDLTSDLVPVTIHRAEIGNLVDAYCALTGSQVQAFDHHDGDGRAWLFVRDTKDERAEIEAFRRMGEIPGEGPVRGISVSVHAAHRLSGRWVAWLRGGTFGSRHASARAVTSRPAPIAVEMLRPTLVPVGFQRASEKPARGPFRIGDGLFLVAGERDGAAYLQTFLAAPDGISAGTPAPLCGRVPERVLARCAPDGDRIDVVWAETTRASTHIFTRAYTLSGRALSAEPVLLYERASPLAALAMFPLETEQTPGLVHALLGPEGQDEQARDLVYARIALDPKQPVEHHYLPVPNAVLDSYAISPLPAGGLVTLASRGSEIWRASALDDPQWRVLHTAPAPVRHLRVAASTALYWAALAFDPSRGVLCIADPGYSRERDA